LEERRETVLATIEEQGKLTPELKAKIEAVLDPSELEDLYLPYKPKRRTKAMIAREKGL
jgi:protein Tex